MRVKNLGRTPLMKPGRLVVVNEDGALGQSNAAGSSIWLPTLEEKELYVATALENTRLRIQVREAERKYKSIFENANEPIFVAQGEKIVFANPKSLEMSGYPLEEFTSRPFIDFIHPDDRAMVTENYLKRIRGEEVPFYACRILNKAGNTIWMEPNAVSINWEGKRATLYLINDITIRKQAEARQGLFLKILDLLNQVGEKGDLIRKILYLLKIETGIEAIGIRLSEGEDFPYYETSGFAETFFEKERNLCARDEKGEIIRDYPGQPLSGMYVRERLVRADRSSPSFFYGGWKFLDQQLLPRPSFTCLTKEFNSIEESLSSSGL